MRTGLFGKLPAKRDFVAVGAPRDFLGIWEAWLQGGLSASRQSLAGEWQAAFLRAPIWRFWLGEDVGGGGAVVGAFMPSVDGVGRYFPLTIFARAEPGEALAPPEIDCHESWLGGAEDLLLSALAEDAHFEALSSAVTALAPPALMARPPASVLRTRSGSLVLRTGADTTAFAILRQADASRLYAGMSFWWTLGGEGFEPCLLARKGLPDPYLFAAMLTGSFDERLG